ncbi:hypothetical protein HDZ31DRAFT_48613 [Schizophyllum fasciatum]
MSIATPKLHVVVCGCGVIGLTSAIRLLQAGYGVTVIAKDLPGDPLHATYASSAAGAHHLSFADDDDLRQQTWDKRTFDVMMAEENTEGDASTILKLRQVEYYATEGQTHIKFFEQLPDFRVHDKDELPPFAVHAVSFTSLTMDTGPYLAKLVNRLEGLGGIVRRATLTSLADALFICPEASAVINCTALGSASLTDVKDAGVYPLRGQVVVLNAPWCRAEGRTLQVGALSADGGEGGERTYIIPRKSGQVIIGGTREENDWYASAHAELAEPRPETTEDIKRRALILYPELVPEKGRISGRSPVPSDLDDIVARVVVGFRPARTGGTRLERGEDIMSGQKKIPVVHNYGHSGAGWQSCWGCAEDVVAIVEQSIRPAIA